MESKWEYIARICYEKGMFESARIAEDIEKILKEIYGNTVTETWEKEYKELKTQEREIRSLKSKVR